MFRIVGWILLFIILAFICGLFAYAPITNFASTNIVARFSMVAGESAENTIESQFNVTFPDSVTDAYRASLGDRAYWIKFSVRPDQLGGMFAGSPVLTCNFPFQDSYRPNFEYARKLDGEERAATTWWNPQDVDRYMGGECTGSDYRLFRMFVDVGSNADLWTLYLEIIQL